MSRPAGLRSKNDDRQPLQVPEDLHSQVAHHALAEEAREPGLREGESELGAQHEEEERACTGRSCPESPAGTATSDHPSA